MKAATTPLEPGGTQAADRLRSDDGTRRDRGARWLRHAGFYGWMLALAASAGVVNLLDLHLSWPMLLPSLELALTVLSPILYYLCFRGTISGRQMLVRIILIFCLGAFVASKLIPTDVTAQWSLSWLRGYVIWVAVAIEVVILVRILRMAFSQHTKASAIAAESGAPLWLARLILLEARFWHALWRMLRTTFRRAPEPGSDEPAEEQEEDTAHVPVPSSRRQAIRRNYGGTAKDAPADAVGPQAVGRKVLP